MKIPDTVPWLATGKTLGSGGQANVYLVTRRDQSDGRNYALKALRNVDSRQARERFLREIEAVKSLDSAFIAKRDINPTAAMQRLQLFLTVMPYLATPIHRGSKPLSARTVALDLSET